MTSAPDPIRPLLSLLIPAYNEEKRLPASLDKILAWRETVPYDVEIVIIENGSSDATTAVAEAYAASHPNLRLLHSPKGKGAAVRAGMLNGRGDYLFICDSDLSMPIEEVEKFLPPRLTGFDVAIGSREAPGAVRYNEPTYRHIMGRVFNLIVRVLAIPGFQDTQCGFKMFRRETALNVFSRQRVTGWTFDVEALYLAIADGARVVEVPIHWYFNPDSRVEAVRDTWNMFWDVLRIRIDAWRGLYDLPRSPGSPAIS
ncbi:MAG: glycosyltransferase family 2 protein [Caldilineales bacterium]|nr:glycosyltransferase family 2 protein [Caldilineales bacterium]MCW5858198.1 glycosyltransferase family 2 protein [Caldilineales bacterium]